MNIAVLGLGFMGTTHLRAWSTIGNARLGAVMSSDPKKLTGDFSGIEGNLGGGSDEAIDLSGVRKYRSVDEALADPEIDAVDICLPTDLHSDVAIAALRAGKHVLVEKPLALDVVRARAVIAEAEKNDRVLMAGQVLRFVPAYCRLADSLDGAGVVRSAIFRRRCGAPAWSEWLLDPARSGGGVFDLLIHDADYCISLWGMPESVRANGHQDLTRGIDVIHAELTYPDMGPVLITGGWHHPKTYPFSMEFTVVTDAATFDLQPGSDLVEYTAEGEQRKYDSGGADPFRAELAYFTGCVLEGKQPAFCPPQQSAQAVGLVRLLVESRNRKGEPLSCRI